jgi:hypothetical protein
MHFKIISPNASNILFNEERLGKIRESALEFSLSALRLVSIHVEPDLRVTNVSVDYGPALAEPGSGQVPAGLIDAARQAAKEEVDALLVCGIIDPDSLQALADVSDTLVAGVPQVAVDMAKCHNLPFGGLMLDWCAPMADELEVSLHSHWGDSAYVAWWISRGSITKPR